MTVVGGHCPRLGAGPLACAVHLDSTKTVGSPAQLRAQMEHLTELPASRRSEYPAGSAHELPVVERLR